MKVLTKEEFFRKKGYFLEEIKKGRLFIYPTDTIYGIGCNAINEDAVKKVRELKERAKQPFSVIVPSIEWVLETCNILESKKKYLKLLLGSYTIILKVRKGTVAKEVTPHLDTLGIRIPKHWISEIVKELGMPIVTTSANRTGKKFMTSLDDLDEKIKNKVSFIIYEGKKEGKPSKIIDLTKEIKVIER